MQNLQWRFGQVRQKGPTVSKEYEARLIERIGQDKVDWLKGPHEAKHYNIDDLKAIKARYTAMAKELAKELA